MTFPIPAARKVFSFAVLQCSLHVFKEYSGSIAIVQFPPVCQRRNAILTLEAAAEIYDRGVYVNPTLPPATPEGEALLRTSYMATHTEALLDEAMDIIGEVMARE